MNKFLNRIRFAAFCALSAVIPKGARLFSNEFPCGVHENGVVTYQSDTALTPRYSVVKLGSDDTHVVVTTANTEIPIGIAIDETTAAAGYATVQLFGAIKGTVRMIASTTITAGAFVVCTAAGQVMPLPTSGGATVYIIGRALHGASAQGDVIEVTPLPVIQRVVGA